MQKTRTELGTRWWRDVSGRLWLKQNGGYQRAFHEGKDDPSDFMAAHGGQTKGTSYRVAVGDGVVLCYVSVRGDGTRDRAVYGRGVVSHVGELRPEHVARAKAAGVSDESIQLIGRNARGAVITLRANTSTTKHMR